MKKARRDVEKAKARRDVDRARSDDYWTIAAMRELGGGFVHALGNAALMADSDNLHRIKLAWPEYWAHYQALGEDLAEQDKHPAGVQ